MPTPNAFFGDLVVGGNSPANIAASAISPRAATPQLPSLGPNQSGSATTSAQASSGLSTGTQRTVLPENWLGTANSGMGELLHEYAVGRDAFDTSEYDEASRKRQARDLAMGMTASQNAAADYVARSRQSGTSGGAAGLIKAQGIISAQDKAGQAEEERTKYDIQQREAAASHASQIANLLGGLRINYLSALAGRDTTGRESTAGSGSQSTISQAADEGGGGGGGSNWYSMIPSGMGAASGVTPFAASSRLGQFSTPTSATNLTGDWNAASYGG